jgi:hypothetical protein
VGTGNLSAIAWSVTALLAADKAPTKMVLLSGFKLLVIFSILLILAVLKLINAWGLLAGFTIVVALIIKEGLIASKKEADDK